MQTTKTTIGGRPATVTILGQVRSRKNYRFYNLMSVKFDDNGEYHTMGGAEFAKWSTKLERDAKRATVG